MDLSRVYTKTSKGILEGNAKTRALSRELGRVLALIDGKSPVSDILEKSSRLSESRLAALLDELVADGFIRLLSGNHAGDDLGFSSTIIVSESNTEAFFEAQADAERALRRAEDRETRTKVAERESLMKELKADIDAEAEALKRQETERQARAQAEQEAERRQAEDAARRQAEQERKAKEAAAAQARAAEAKAQAEAEARAQALEAEVQARTEAARKAKQEAAQRAQAEAQAKARAEAEKKARIEAEKQAAEAVRAREAAERKAREEADAKTRLAKEAAATAQRELEAKIQAEEEAQRRSEMEARLREMEHAKNQAQKEAQTLAKALDEARIAAELENRVKRRLEARAREEAEIHERVAAEAQAKLEQEARLRAEAEARARAEEDARIEAERQAQAELEAERKARAEAEKRAHEAAQARAQAEEEARKRAADEAQAKLEQEMRMRAEAEARARAEEAARIEAERQAQAKLEAERKAHAEAEARRQEQEAKQAQLEAERRTQEEEARKAQADALAREQAEAAARLQAEQEARRQAEAEARAVAEAEEAIRLEAEAAKRQLAEQQREEETRRAREAAERELAAERQARAVAEAAAKALAEERTRMEAAAKAREEERQRTREDAEANARAEAEEALRRAQAEARQEEEEETRLREEAQARALAAAQGAPAFPFLTARRKRARFDKRWIKPIAAGIAALVLIAIGIVHLVPFNFYIPQLERQLTASLGQRVVVQDIRFSAFPAPHLKLAGVTIGDLASVRIAKARLFPSFSSWFSDQKVMRRVELESVALAEDSVSALSVWSRHQAQATPILFERLQIKDAKLAHRLLDLFAFDADMEMDKGRFVKAQIKSTDQRITLHFLPQGDALGIELSAVGSVLPLEPKVQFDTLKVSALARAGNLTVSSIEGQLYGGSLTGTARMDWQKGWTFSADVGLRQVAIEPSLQLFTREIRIDGVLEAKVRIAAQAASLETLFDSPQLQATFRAKNGEFSGIDLVRAIQAPSRTGNVGGKTHFNELTGAMQLAKGRYQYRQIKLQGGVISASGNLDVGAEGKLAGNLTGELRTRATTMRTPFIFGGTLASPTLRVAMRTPPVKAPAEEVTQ